MCAQSVSNTKEKECLKETIRILIISIEDGEEILRKLFKNTTK